MKQKEAQGHDQARSFKALRLLVVLVLVLVLVLRAYLVSRHTRLLVVLVLRGYLVSRHRHAVALPGLH